MARTVADVMTDDLATVSPDSPVTEAARAMRDHDTGSVLVVDGGRVSGIVTDRDIAVRLVAEGQSPDTPVSQICSAEELTTVTPTTSLGDAVRAMRDHSVRRLPVVDGDRPVGVLSLGDLAIELDDSSVLAEISAAASNG